MAGALAPLAANEGVDAVKRQHCSTCGRRGHNSARCGTTPAPARERAVRGGPWLIVTAKTGRPYIARGWPTEAAAAAVLADLLKPYPAGHAWRRALAVRHKAAGAEERAA